jgi:Protein of unknown function (DUF992)
MKLSRISISAAIAATAMLPALVLLPTAALAQAAGTSNTQIGVLRCDVASGTGFVIGSSKELGCRFTPRNGRAERYSGSFKRFGLDLGSTRKGSIVWAVLAPARLGPGALAGDYVGASGEATVGVGAGANLLVGGFGNSISLQPVSLQSQRGFNFALGIGDLRLVSASRR